MRENKIALFGVLYYNAVIIYLTVATRMALYFIEVSFYIPNTKVEKVLITFSSDSFVTK